ncbi:MAG: hypothetical protein LW692_06895 [Sphingobacteriales bacterium]|jgi:methionyl-tRNA formyltransferase|nr:hypothetical protein [Sphingobacteriales bacterium]
MDNLKYRIVAYLGGGEGKATLDVLCQEGFIPISVVIAEGTREKNKDIISTCQKEGILIIERSESEGLLIQQNEYNMLISSSFPHRIYKTEISNISGPSVNIHSAILPLYRGANSGTWALINGDTTIGVTIHEINEHFDAGKILGIYTTKVNLSMWYDEIREQLSNIKKNLLIDYLRDTLLPQDQKISDPRSIYWRKRTKEDSRINWHMDAKKVFLFIRALARDPIYGFSNYNSTKYIFKKVSLTKYQNFGLLAGEVFDINGTLFINCGDNFLLKIESYETTNKPLVKGLVLH